MRFQGSPSGLAQWVKDLALLVSSGVGHRCFSDLALLWLGCRPAAIALLKSLAWDPTCAVGVDPKIQKKGGGRQGEGYCGIFSKGIS